MCDLCCSYFRLLLSAEAEPHERNQNTPSALLPISGPVIFPFLLIFRSGSHGVAAVRRTRQGAASAASHRVVKNTSRLHSRRPPASSGKKPFWAPAQLEADADRLLRAGSYFVVISSDTARQVHLGEPRRRPGQTSFQDRKSATWSVPVPRESRLLASDLALKPSFLLQIT